MNDVAAWGAFRTAVGDQIPPETYEALASLTPENLGELAEAHTTEGLLLAATSGETEPEEGVVPALIARWREENQQAEKQASESARIVELEAELERLKRENEQLSFSSRAAKEQAASLGREVEVLLDEREGAAAGARRAEERAATALDLRARMGEKVAELEKRARHLERILEGERDAYTSAAERLEEMHDELGQVVAERDRIQDALENARFTDEGFGELLIRAVKNEVGSLPNTLDATARTAQLMEFMGSVLRAHAELREPRTGAQRGGPAPSSTEEPEDADPSPARPQIRDRSHREAEPGTVTKRPAGRTAAPERTRPTLSFRALGGAGEVGGSSHLLDFGGTRLLVDAGIKPDGRGSLAPNFREVEGLDAASTTHTHLDHCGALPLLVRDQPGVPIYCTPPSAKLIAAALNDHAAMGGGLPGGAPLSEVKKRLVPVSLNKLLKGGDTRITLTESGRILGAASVLFETGSATVFHTGNICLEDHFSIPSVRLPNV